VSIAAWTYLLVGLSFALYIGIAWWSRVRSTAGFYVAGRGVHPVANGMATAADWMSAASFISLAGGLYFRGYDGLAFILGWTGGYVLVAVLIAPYLRKFGAYTVPDFLGSRFGGGVARSIGILVLFCCSFTYIVGQVTDPDADPFARVVLPHPCPSSPRIRHHVRSPVARGSRSPPS